MLQRLHRSKRDDTTNNDGGYMSASSSPSQMSFKGFGGGGGNRRRRFRRSSSKDSDISLSERSFPDPPSYNQPAYAQHQTLVMTDDTALSDGNYHNNNNNNNIGHRRRKNFLSSDYSRGSDDELDLQLDDSYHPPPPPPQGSPKTSRKKKKGLRRFLSAGKKKASWRNNRNKDGDGGASSEPPPPPPQQRQRNGGREPRRRRQQHSNGSDTDDSLIRPSRAPVRRGIKHALSFGQRSSDGGGDDDDFYERNSNGDASCDSVFSYDAPMNFGDGPRRGARKQKPGDRTSTNMNMNEHLQMSFGSVDSKSLDSKSLDSFPPRSEDEDTEDDFRRHQFEYTESEEFSLNMANYSGGVGGSGVGGKRRGSSAPIDSINYNQVNRHQKDLASQNLQAIESMARKEGHNPADEAFLVMPDDAYPNTKMTRKQLRKNTNMRSAYYHDLRLQSQSRSEIGELRLEIMQCFGLPTTSLIREVSAYAVAVNGGAAFQTDVIPNVANPMWLSKMRRACLFPVQQMYSQLCIGIFDLEAVFADPSTVLGHPGHPGWVPPEQRVKFLGRSSSIFSGGSNNSLSRGRAGSSGNFNISQRGSSAQLSVNNHNDDEDEDGAPPVHLQPNDWCTKAEDFIGHVVVDICRLRPGSTYDITLPLRRSKHVFTREPQGSVRVRLHLEWNSERSAVMSYLPKRLGGTVNFERRPNTRYSVNCVDDRAARNVAHAVHGIHMPGKFDMTLLKSTIREIHWTRIHLLRYCKNREIYHLAYWVYPSISGFVFLAWMHAVYFNTVRYVPGHVVVFVLLHLLKNYAYYAMDSPLQNGFLAPTLEELYCALLKGAKKRKVPCIDPLTVEREADPISPMATTGLQGTMDELYDENGTLVHVSRYPLADIAEAMKKSLETRPYRKGFSFFKHTFQGDDAVDFLILKGFAMTREEAVSIGRRLEKEKRLFQHVTKDFLFEDSPYIYFFLDADTENYLNQNMHTPKGGRILELLGFYHRSKGRAGGKHEKGKLTTTGGADILASREQVEFPFATGMDHSRFTVKESLVIRSAEEKFRLKREDEAKTQLEVAEFGIVPSRGSFGSTDNPQRPGMFKSGSRGGGPPAAAAGGYESETGTKATGTAAAPNRRNLMTEIRRASQANLMGGDGVVGRTARRGSAMIGATANVVAAGANRMVGWGHGHSHGHGGSNVVEVATGEAVYAKLKEQNNATLNKVLELQRKADEYDPYQYDSDDDVRIIRKKKRKKHVIVEKHLRKPTSQEFSNIGSTGAVDMSLAKSLEKTKRHLGAMTYHMFDDQLYKIDRSVFPIRLEGGSDHKIKKKKKRGLFSRKASVEEEKEEEERQKKSQMTPYEQQQETLDKVLLINHHSHWNPWMNRIAIVMQPLLEMSQTVLFFFRALFNLFTWQDPVLCFWLCVVGPPLALVLYLCPYRWLFGFLGIYWIGPQNYVIRIYRESKESYEPPNFDMIVKTKKLEKEESTFDEMRFFSSEAPGNQQIRFRNIDPRQVKQIVVPSNVLMYGRRFYTWPPEPKYARVYASEAPANLIEPSYAGSVENGGGGVGGGYESETTTATTAFVYDQAARKRSEEEAAELLSSKKKRKGGVVGKKVRQGLRKGSAVGEQVLGATAGATASITRSVVKGTGKRAQSAAKGTGNLLRLRKKHGSSVGGESVGGRYRQPSKYYSDDESEFSYA